MSLVRESVVLIIFAEGVLVSGKESKGIGLMVLAGRCLRKLEVSMMEPSAHIKGNVLAVLKDALK